MNVWLGNLRMNVAKEVKWIKTIHHMCNSCGSFSTGCETKIAYLSIVQHPNVMF